MKVLLVNPNRMQPPVAPLAVDYLGEALARSGIGCEVADFCLDPPFPPGAPPRPARPTTDAEPDAVLLTLRNLDDAYFFSQASFLPLMRTMVHSVREQFRRPVIVGGCGFSIAPVEILDFLGADFGVSGAAEGDLIGFLAALGKPELYGEIPGLVWGAGNTLRANPPSVPDMTRDYFSARRFVRNRDYFERGGMVGLETKRGCPGRCVYCVDPVAKGKEVAVKPLPVLIREMRNLLDQGVPVFHLCDSEFNLPREHALAVCRAVTEEGLHQKVRWYTYATPLGFDEELAFEMAAAGCAGINFGADHCRREILRALGREHDEQDLAQAAAACRRAGISHLFDLLLGGPGETRATLKEVIDLCRDLGVQRVGANAGIRVYPNTPLAGEIIARGTLESHPDLAGRLQENQALLHPVFYVSAALGRGWEEFLQEAIGEDPRFFVPVRTGKDRNYNYNENQVLVDAIRRGHRGAFWDILYRLQENLPPLSIPA